MLNFKRKVKFSEETIKHLEQEVENLRKERAFIQERELLNTKNLTNELKDEQ